MKQQLLLIVLVITVSFSSVAYSGDITFLNQHNSVDTVDAALAPEPEVGIQNGEVIVTWRNLGVYLGDTAPTTDTAGFAVFQEDPEVIAKRITEEVLTPIAKRKALRYLNGKQQEPLSTPDLNDGIVKGLEVHPDFSSEEKKSEGFLFSYRHWLQFNLVISMDVEPLRRQLAGAVEKAENRKKRARIRKKRARIRKERQRQEEVERQARLEREELKRLERERLEKVERQRQLAEVERRREQEERARLANLDVIQWGAKQTVDFEFLEEIQEDDQLRSMAEQQLRYWRGKQREQTNIPAAPDNLKMVALGSLGEQLCYPMGSPVSEKERFNDERQHRVCIQGFRIASHEVTNAMYRRHKASHDSGEHKGYSLNGPQQSVVEVSWNEANDYIAWLNQTLKPVTPYRLPTEAEWEYAARGGTTSRRYWGEDWRESEGCDYANVYNPSSKREFGWGYDSFNCEDGHKVSAPVGQFTPNGYGLYDMLGNVWEWSSSEYEREYGGKELRPSTQGRDSGLRVLRGGSWLYGPRFLRAAGRFLKKPGYRLNSIGFRIAQDL